MKDNPADFLDGVLGVLGRRIEKGGFWGWAAEKAVEAAALALVLGLIGLAIEEEFCTPPEDRR